MTITHTESSASARTASLVSLADAARPGLGDGENVRVTSRHGAVEEWIIFFETAAIGGASIEGGNPIRNESFEEAVMVDGRLRGLWARHPRFVLVPNNPSFFKKISFGLAALESIVSQFTCKPAPHAHPRQPHRRGPHEDCGVA